ncbi:MAG: 4-hydroxy-tetrahydrodipicolinate reductase [Chloroflexi bacterium]|nr:4-hydroxy-tetrahydrodipicolinate reductase [Chloroflexota bacterium]
MTEIRVVVHGAAGRMGQVMLQGLAGDPELNIVGAVDARSRGDSLPSPYGSGTIPYASDLGLLLHSVAANVVVDFSNAEAVLPAARAAAARGVNLVVGTTGLAQETVAEISELATVHETGAIVAPNFALGAVLMMQMAKLAAKYFDYSEIFELHHEQKADAPSGTSLSTARLMLESRGKPFKQATTQKETLAGTRGGSLGGIAIHSVRLPGFMAHQEVVLGGLGQTLSIRHDTTGRDCYVPGVILAVKKVVNIKGLIYGLDTLLGF